MWPEVGLTHRKAPRTTESGGACHQGSHGWHSPGEPGAQAGPRGQAAQTTLSGHIRASVDRSARPCPPPGPGAQLTVRCHLPLLAVVTALSQGTGLLSKQSAGAPSPNTHTRVHCGWGCT